MIICHTYIVIFTPPPCSINLIIKYVICHKSYMILHNMYTYNTVGGKSHVTPM